MRVLHVPAGIAPRIGGPAVMAFEAAGALSQLGISTAVWAPDLAVGAQAKRYWSITEADLPPDLDAVDVRLFKTRPPRRLVFAPSLYRALGRELRDFDLVHIHNLWTFPQFAAYRQAARLGKPYVVAPSGALDPWLRAKSRRVKAISDRVWQRDMLERATLLHYKTEDEARRAADLGIPAPYEIVPNGIAWDRFQQMPDPAGFRAVWMPDASGPIVMTLGRISEKKGIDILIRAFPAILREHADARLVVVGPDDEQLTPGLKELAASERVGDKVVFTGTLVGPDRLEALAAADVWALPSHFENFGLAVAEAMASGRATVISPGVQIADAVAEEDAGEVMPELSPEALATAVNRLLGDDARRERLSARAREFARRYDWSAVAPVLAAMYERALGVPRETVAQASP